MTAAPKPRIKSGVAEKQTSSPICSENGPIHGGGQAFQSDGAQFGIADFVQARRPDGDGGLAGNDGQNAATDTGFPGNTDTEGEIARCIVMHMSASGH